MFQQRTCTVQREQGSARLPAEGFLVRSFAPICDARVCSALEFSVPVRS
jgi:hypothetical protein